MYTRLLLPLLCGALTLASACQGEISDDADSPDMMTVTDAGGQLDASPSIDMMNLSGDMSVAPREDMPEVDMPGVVGDMRDEDASDMAPDLVQDMTEESPVALIVAQGRMGRTVMTCDGGQTWFADRDMPSEGRWGYCDMVQTGLVCDVGPCMQVLGGECVMDPDCKCRDHTTGSAKRLTWYDGQFLATFGWGQPGSLFRSSDGMDWEEVSIESRPTVTGAAGGAGALVLSSDRVYRSTDGGTTWSGRERADRLQGMGHSQGITYLDGSGPQGRFINIGRTGAFLSDDAGESWRPVSQWPSWSYRFNENSDYFDVTCGNFSQGFADNGQGTVIIGRSHGDWCISTDYGETFTRLTRPGSGPSGSAMPHFARGKFHVIAERFYASSPDGQTWEVHDLEREAWSLRTAYDPVHDRFVGIRGKYEEQRFLWSEDGINWQQLDMSSAPRGHQIKWLAQGWAPAGFVCPTGSSSP